MTSWREHRRRTELRGAAAQAYAEAEREMGIGILILRARASAGLTQRELAGRIGTSQPTIARWESGAQVPSVRSLTKIADATGFRLTVGLRREGQARQYLIVSIAG
jgi:transcriptional regulator with XRE-family HTH domain